MEYGGCVYIMTNKKNGVLYTGVTSNLKKRVLEHKQNFHSNSFTAKYNCHLLVYFYSFTRIEFAIAEEKRIKGGNRATKIKLIETQNPTWEDLFERLL
ncbi:MAG: GIY-YIG nuclease family protein [Prevotellaceae bacterium]|jgi:putative endonuclease|nr:GIY-YIG nuclease family protein [Prevotellaceae bacterium]